MENYVQDTVRIDGRSEDVEVAKWVVRSFGVEVLGSELLDDGDVELQVQGSPAGLDLVWRWREGELQEDLLAETAEQRSKEALNRLLA